MAADPTLEASVRAGPVTIDTARPVDLGLTLALAGRDRTMRVTGNQGWLASRTPGGPATLHVRLVGTDRVEACAYGPGAAWALGQAPALLGAADHGGGLERDAHPLIRSLARRFAGWRIGATGDPFAALVPSVLEQKVQGASARASYRAVLRAHGSPAPAPPGGPPLLLPPSPEWLLAQPSWAWHRWGVEAKRATTIRTAASYAHRVAETAAMDRDAARARLLALPGIGPWTVAEVAAVAFGDPDAVSVGDYWLCHWVCHNLGGRARGTDAEMLELLAPWEGQRGRVSRLLMLGGDPPPRFGPRLAFQPIAHL